MDYSLVADLYDTYVQTSVDIPFFTKEAKKSRGSILELMSGTGRVSVPLIEKGIKLVCVDKSPAMLAVLRGKLHERGLSADIYESDVRKLTLNKKYDLIFIPFQSISELYKKDDQIQVLSDIYNLLNTNGRFICTLHNPKVRLKKADGRMRLWSVHPLQNKQGELHRLAIESYDPDSCQVTGYQYFEEYDVYGVMKSKKAIRTRYCLLDRISFQKCIKKLGFETVSLYGDYEYNSFNEDTSPYMIWILKK